MPELQLSRIRYDTLSPAASRGQQGGHAWPFGSCLRQHLTQAGMFPPGQKAFATSFSVAPCPRWHHAPGHHLAGSQMPAPRHASNRHPTARGRPGDEERAARGMDPYSETRQVSLLENCVTALDGECVLGPLAELDGYHDGSHRGRIRMLSGPYQFRLQIATERGSIA